MTLEEENAALWRENVELCEQLATVLARIAALETPSGEPSSFVKPIAPT